MNKSQNGEFDLDNTLDLMLIAELNKIQDWEESAIAHMSHEDYDSGKILFECAES